MATRSTLQFKKNDRIVFLGDSMTEQQLYTNFVETYLTLRYPEFNLTFFNAGWGGDTAGGGFERLERDVLALKPNVVTICYGMNDASYTHPTPAILERFAKGMTALVKKLKARRVRAVLLTPGFADVEANQNLKDVDYNRKGLRALADHVLELAGKQKLAVYDIHKLMSDVDGAGKRLDARFNLAPDGFHPNPAGHLPMAYGLLKALGVPPDTASADVDVKTRKGKGGDGIKLSAIKPTSYGYAWDMTLDRLPLFLAPDARGVLPHLPFQEEFNRLMVRVRGIDNGGKYFLRFGVDRTAPMTAQELEQGIDLFSLWDTPPMHRAASVHQFTNEKVQVFFKLWRMLALAGGKTDYRADPHRAGMAAMPALEKARRDLARIEGTRFRIQLVSDDLRGEPVENGDFISQWHVRGPLPEPFSRDALGGEQALTASPPRPDQGWMPATVDMRIPNNNLGALIGPANHCFAYAMTQVDSPIDQTAELLIGSDDGFAAWLNGHELASQLDLKRGVTIDQDRFPVKLRKGPNYLLMKISQDTGNWGFCVRFNGLKQELIARFV